MQLRIIRRTNRYAVVDKPSGLLSVRGKGPGKEDCVPARVLAMIPEATGPMVVHRLDMDTSGLMVVALDPQAQRDLSLQFERRNTFKRYLALLAGHLPIDTAASDHAALTTNHPEAWPVIDCPIRLDPDNRPYQIHDPVHGKPSQTRFRILAHAWLTTADEPRPVTRVEFEPLTGRSHQLRVHAALPPTVGGLGYPIVGDPLYGITGDRIDPSTDEATQDRIEAHKPRLMLHAATLGFTEPGTDRWIVCHAPCPWDNLLNPA